MSNGSDQYDDLNKRKNNNSGFLIASKLKVFLGLGRGTHVKTEFGKTRFRKQRQEINLSGGFLFGKWAAPLLRV